MPDSLPPALIKLPIIIATVGNYGESFERNLGKGSRIAIDRGLNRLWTQGGLQNAPPIR